jgi:ribosome-binding factor A
MPSKIRLQRIADRYREELSEMLIMNVADPRLSGVTITDVKVDRELTFADIYVSAVEGRERKEEILQALGHARGFLRSSIADRVELRVHPQLRFHWDMTPERADKIDRLIFEMHKDDEKITDTGEKQPDEDNSQEHKE